MQPINIITHLFLALSFPLEIWTVTGNLDITKAVPSNDIPIKFVKLIGTTVSNFLSECFNLWIVERAYLMLYKLHKLFLLTKLDQKNAAQIIDEYLQGVSQLLKQSSSF